MKKNTPLRLAVVTLTFLLLISLTSTVFLKPAKCEWSSPIQLTDNLVEETDLSISGDGSKIVFSYYYYDWEIFVINSDGSGLTQLTNNDADDRYPCISGDGSKIAFESDLDGDWEIFVINSDGSGLTQLTNNDADDRYPCISGDGSLIAYQCMMAEDSEIFKVYSDGTGFPTQITDNSAEDLNPSISGDGSKIAFQSDWDGDWEIFVINSDGSELKKLSTAGAIMPCISGDGSKVAFRSWDYDYDIFVVNSDGSELKKLTINNDDDGSPSISYDGSQIAYESDVYGTYDIFVVNSDGSAVNRLTGGYADERSPCMSSDGSKIVYRKYWESQWEIFVISQRALSLDGLGTWYWTGDTVINSVARGDVDGDGNVEIVTGGYYFDGARCVAQLCVWNGATLELENVKTWYWTSNTLIYSVSVGDVDGDGENEIVTGGVDGTSSAQLCVWNGATLALENIRTWLWSSFSRVCSVAIGDLDGDGGNEIVTGGHFSNLPDVMGPQTADAQLCIWDGTTLSLEGVRTWKWGVNTWINMIAVDDVDGDGEGEVVTGGCYNDGVRDVAQLCVWDGVTIALENVQTWWWIDNTVIESVGIGDVDGDGGVEVVTGGWFWDGSGFNSQLCVWSGDSLAVEDVQSWCWGSASWIMSIAVGDVDVDVQDEIVTGGSYIDSAHHVAQLCIWEY